MVLQRILTGDPQPDKRLRPDSSHRRMAHLNCPTVSKVSCCLVCLALETARRRDRRDKRDKVWQLVVFLFFYSSLQYPFVSVVRKRKILIFALIISKLIVITYCESVFRESLLENVEVFKTSRTIRTTLTFV